METLMSHLVLEIVRVDRSGQRMQLFFLMQQIRKHCRVIHTLMVVKHSNKMLHLVPDDFRIFPVGSQPPTLIIIRQ